MVSKEALNQYLRRQLDSFTWMKKLPRDEVLHQLKQLRVKPQFKGHERWTHQLVCFYIGLCCPEFLFLLDMGLGKTAIILDLMTQLLRESKIKRSLVTVPRLINLDSWSNDTNEHSNLEIHLAEGSIEEKFEALVCPKGDLTVIDYPGLHLALCVKGKIKKGSKWVNGLVRDDKKIDMVRKQYQLFTGDEIHKSKNKDSLRFELLKHLTKHMPYRFGLTGTPFGRDPMALWAQFYIIDRGATFGETIGIFREAFFHAQDGWFGGTKYEFDKEMARHLYRCLQHRSIRYSRDEVPDVEMPESVKRRETIRFGDEQREHYLRAVDGLISAKGNVREMDNAFLRMRQITSGYLSWKDNEGDHTIYFKQNPKLDAIERFVDESGDAKVVISTEFTNSGRIIVNRLNHLGHKTEWLYGGTKDPIACARRFINDPDIKALVMNSEAGGTGVDGLQKVASYLIFYESPVSPITRKQTLNRVDRTNGLKRNFIIDLVMEKSIDFRVLSFIDEGRNLHETVVNGKFSRDDFI